ncbi:hypothetical protein [Phormidesmis sp. 146-33]
MSHAHDRPQGIRVAALVQMSVGILGLLYTAPIVIHVSSNLQGQPQAFTLFIAGIGESLMLPLLSFVQVVTGFGMLKFRRWSWLGSLIVQIMILLASLLGLSFVGLIQLVSLITSVGLIYFLAKPSVRIALRRDRQ